MQLSSQLRLLGYVGAGLLVLTACGAGKSAAGSTTAAAAAATSTSHTQTTNKVSAAPAAVGSTRRTSAAVSPSHAPKAATKTCSGKEVAATIGGAPKCLQAGQECQSKAAAQYPTYGFECVQSGNRWVLRKRS
jgi:hypothetical protein